MAEYLIQGETLESMADKIRILNGVSGNMSPAQMDGNLGEANTEVSEQAGLIAQISSALEGKAGGGGSSSTGTYTVRNNLSCDVYIGGTCIPTGESMLFPVSQGSVTLMTIMVKSTNTSLSAYFNNTAATMTLYAERAIMNSGSISLNNGLSGCFFWIIVFTSSPKSGDIIDIG